MNSTPEHKAECLRKWNEHHPDSIHHAHLMNLRGIPGAKDRTAYLEAVDRKEGAQAAQRLKDEYAVIWKARQEGKSK